VIVVCKYSLFFLIVSIFSVFACVRVFYICSVLYVSVLRVTGAKLLEIKLMMMMMTNYKCMMMILVMLLLMMVLMTSIPFCLCLRMSPWRES